MSEILSIEEANVDIPLVIDRLTTQSARLVVDPAALAAVVALYGDATTPGTWVFTMPFYADKKGKRTPEVTETMNDLKTEIYDKFAAIYNDIPASRWNDGDRNTFRRKTGARQQPTRKTEKIKEAPVVSVKVIEDYEYRITHRLPVDGSKNSLHPQATEIECKYVYVDTDLEEDDTTSKVKKERPKNASQCWDTISFTKATSICQTESSHEGREICGFSRYFDPRYPQLAGPWSKMWTITVR